MIKQISILLLLLLPLSLFSQIHLNKVWTTETGNPLANEWQSSITNANNEVISVGNTLDVTNGFDMLVTKMDGEGNIIWESKFNTGNSNNDYGVSLAEDANGNICVIGTTDNGTTANNNTIVLMYDGNGVLQWSNIFNSSFNKNDNATALKMDGNGNIYVAAASETDFTNYDYLLLKYNAAGTLQWQASYDYDSLIEIPISIDIDASNNIFITGASASSINNWDYTIASFSSAGSLLNDERISSPGIGFDKPMSFKKDGVGNIYITGSSSTNGINYDIQTIKLNSAYVLQWTVTMDGAFKTDVGNSVDVDAQGNVYVGGYLTLSNNRKQIILIKYDSNGVVVWRHTQEASNAIGDASIKAIDVKNNKEIYFIGQELGYNSTQDAIISKLGENGRILWQKTINTVLDDKPMTLNITNDGGVLITTLKNGSISAYETTKYAEVILDSAVVWDTVSGNPLFMAHQLIVRFQQAAINKSVIDNIAGNKDIVAAGIDYFLTRPALDKINDALAPLCTGINGGTSNPCKIKAVKVFTDMKTTETTIINNLGELIPIPDFWTTLLLEFSSTLNIVQVHAIIDTIQSVVRYSEPNRIPLSANINYCNDTSFAKQMSLVFNPSNPTYIGNINVESAWDIVPDGGKQYIRCGIFDTGLDWKHKDWGYDGTDPNSSKIAGGWDYLTLSSLKSNSQGESDSIYSHGTAVAGIIGAQRNNVFDIAGIAGGNDSLNTKGINMYSFHVTNNGSFVWGAQMNTMFEAIRESIMPIDNNKRYSLNIQNHSWRYDNSPGAPYNFSNNNLLTEAVHFANRNQVTFVACRGNEGTDNLCLPAIIDDDWVLNVGGTGSNGCHSHYTYFNDPSPINSNMNASFGHNVDIGAPAYDQMITTLKRGDTIQKFWATSAATPHVTGVVGLLMSYMNDSLPAYKNLAPEDCEKIIEISAKDDTCYVGWDKYIGAGLLDAGKALQLVQKPNKALTHFGSNPNSNSTMNTNYKKVDSNNLIHIRDQFLIYNNYTFAPISLFKINKYLVTANFSHNLPTGYFADTFWARPSSSNLIQDIENDTLSPRERINVLNCNSNSCTIQGFLYEIFDTNGVFKAWWPCHKDSLNKKVKIEYTVLSHLAPLQITKTINQLFEISVLPNPTRTFNEIQINSKKDAIVSIILFDITGRKISVLPYNKIFKGKNKFNNDITLLPSGLYFYQVIIDNQIYNYKIIKE
jgi:Subtilase family